MYIETDSRDAHAILERVLFALPVGLAREIRAVGGSRLGFPYGLCEIRLRRHGACTMLFYGESVRLLSGVCKEEITAFLDRVTEGSLYAYRTAIADGYVPLGAGVRLGVCGVAGYDGDRLVGVRDISSLAIRFPFATPSYKDELCSAFLSATSGMLIYSPPGEGKTTALRALISSLSGRGRRIAVVDERCELSFGDYRHTEVDFLTGYRISEGIELATRALNPEIIVIDEIGARDAAPIRRTVRCGIPVIATAHARDKDELLSKPWIREMINDGAFDLLAGLFRGRIEVSRAQEAV